MTSGSRTKSSRWLHSDDQLAPESGVSYELRYVGSMPVRVSIKAVDLETRTRIAHASIHKVCEDVGRKLPRPSRPDKSLAAYLGAESDKNWAMTNVYLTITSQTLTVETMDFNWPIFRHNLSMVSFASGGDAETLDFVCYVAKDDRDQRMCYVFECPGGLAQDVIMTLGQAFKLGYQDFKKGKTPPPVPASPGSEAISGNGSNGLVKPHHSCTGQTQSGSRDLTSETNVDSKEQSAPSSSKANRSSRSPPSHTNPVTFSGSSSTGTGKADADREPLSRELSSDSLRGRGGGISSTFDNFADFDENAWLLENDASNADALDAPNPRKPVQDQGFCKQTPIPDPTRGSTSPSDASGPSAVRAAGVGNAGDLTTTQPTVPFAQLEPVGEPWYVGKMSRSQAESLLRYEGDFLVRASPHQPGQFVLSGMQDSKCRHLLLADPNGLVRTKERVFDSIQHLIDYHVQNGVPIRSADSEIRLIFPVSTFSFCES